jgi:isoquinoline 1-oxidoreductase beta subunit
MSTDLSTPLNRRSFLRLSALAGGGLVLGLDLKPGAKVFAADLARVTAEGDFAPSAFVRIARDGSVTIYAARPEIGQGIKTSLPMVLAEELSVDWQSVRVVSAPFDPAFGEGALHGQAAGGSSSTPNSYSTLLRIGATARTMLLQAAAQTWSVPVNECYAEGGFVYHRGTDQKISYGELVPKACTLPIPPESEVHFKDPKDYHLLGSRVGGVDNPKIVTGQPLFGIDQKVPGMSYAVYEKCPVWGGKVLSANLEQIKALPGVRDAFINHDAVPFKDGVTGLVPGVAIVADSTWSAFSARQQLQVQWDEGRYADASWGDFGRQARELAARGKTHAPDGQSIEEVRRDGDVDSALASAARVLEANYSYPFISHATLEPQNCTARVEGGRAEVWAPTQNPAAAQKLVAAVLNVPLENVTVHVTRSGGGFGRRLDPDPVAESAMIAQRAGVPIKLVWNRTDDIQHDHYRSGGFHFLKGGLDASGKLIAWRNHFVHFGSPWMGTDDYPARFIPNYLLIQSILPNSIPQGPWRAPGSNVYAFVFCGFLDELAHAAGQDPVKFNLALLGDRGLVPASGAHGRPYNAARMRGVIETVAEKSGWGKSMPRGQGQGFAYYFSHQGYFAEVAEVTVSKSGDLAVERVVVAADVGSQIVNLSGAENQIQGSVIDGLSAALHQELGIEKGRVVQTNFHEYPMLRISDAPPKIEIHYVKTEYSPTGLGEPALPPVAPAVANAIFAATGKRIREFPFSHADLRWT